MPIFCYLYTFSKKPKGFEKKNIIISYFDDSKRYHLQIILYELYTSQRINIRKGASIIEGISYKIYYSMILLICLVTNNKNGKEVRKK